MNNDRILRAQKREAAWCETHNKCREGQGDSVVPEPLKRMSTRRECEAFLEICIIWICEQQIILPKAMSPIMQHVYVISKLACLLSCLLVQWSVTKLRGMRSALNTCFLKIKTSPCIYCPQHHTLYIYMVCLISSSLLIRPKRISLTSKMLP